MLDKIAEIGLKVFVVIFGVVVTVLLVTLAYVVILMASRL